MSKKLEETFEAYKCFSDRRAREMNYDCFLKCCKDCGIVDGYMVRGVDIKQEYDNHITKGGLWDFQCFKDCLLKIAEKRLKDQNPKEIFTMVEGTTPK